MAVILARLFDPITSYHLLVANRKGAVVNTEALRHSVKNETWL